MLNRENEAFLNQIDELIRQANDLLPDVIEKTKPSDERAKKHKLNWTKRHRLHVLLDAAQETKEKLIENIIVAPWFLAELKATVEVINRWHNDPLWREVKPCLVNPTHFTHTIAKLWIAEHLKSMGHVVKIVPRGDDASPDLAVQAIGGLQDWVYIECYQPSQLNGGEKVTPKQMESIVKKAMKKAKTQLNVATPGILAICGFNQPKDVVEHLKRLATERLQKTDRQNLCGILLFMLRVLVRKTENGLSFTSIKYVDFIPNLSYFGRVEIESFTPTDDSNLIKEPLIDISTETLLHKPPPNNEHTKKEDFGHNTIPRMKIIKEEKLRVIEKPAANTRVIFYSQTVEPLFIGDGNTNFLCGACGAILAQRAWKNSFSNIVIKCPSCQSYNEFQKIKEIRIQLLGTLAFQSGEYFMKSAVKLRRGACLIGL
jgi:phage FluMu protein Com